MNYREMINLSEKGEIKGGEEKRKEIVETALFMYEKIKFISRDERLAIIKIMEILSKNDIWF